MRKSSAKKSHSEPDAVPRPLDRTADAPKGGLVIDQRADGISGAKRIGANAGVRDNH